MKNVFRIAMTSLALLTNCSANSSGNGGVPAVTYTTDGLAFKTVDDSLNGAKALSPTPAAAMYAENDQASIQGAGLSAFWSTDAFISNPKYDGTPACAAYSTNVSLKEYMGTQFNENQKRCNG